MTVTARMFRGASRVLSAELLAVPAGLVIVGFLTRILGPHEFGIYALTVGLITWLEWSLNTLFGRASIRLIGETEDWKPAASEILRIVGLVAICISGGLMFSAGLIARLFHEEEVALLLRCFAVDIPIATAVQSQRAFAVGREDYSLRSRLAVVRWIARPSLIVLFVTLVPSLPAAAAGWVTASLVEVFLCWKWSPISLRLPSHNAFRTRLLSLALPLSAFGLIMRFYDKMDLFALKISGGSAAAAGMYGAAQSISLAPGILTLSFAPLILGALTRSRTLGMEEEAQALTRNSLRLLLILLPFAVLGSVASSEIVRIVFGSEFQESAPSLRWLAFSAYSAAVLAFCSAILAAREKQALVLRLSLPMLPLALAGYLVFIPLYGPPGAAAVSAVIAGATAIVMLSAVFHVWKVASIWGTLTRSILASVLIAVVLSSWNTLSVPAFAQIAVCVLAIPVVFLALGEWRKPKLESTAEYWGGVAEEIQQGAPQECWRMHMKRIYRRLVHEWLSESKSGIALKTDLFEEAVCDHGLLSQLGPKSIGVDYSLTVARSAQKRLSLGDYDSVVVCDLRSLPFRTDSFGRILSGSSLDHFASEEELDCAIRQVARVLKPGGTLVLTLDNPSNPIVWIRNHLPFGWMNRIGLVPYYMGYTCSAAEAGRKLQQSGLNVTHSTSVLHVPRVPAIWLARFLEYIGSGKLVSWYVVHLEKWERLRNWPTRFLTGYYIAVRATKPAL